MRAGDPIESSMSALQTVLKKLNPSYEWPPVQQTKHNQGACNGSSFTIHPSSNYTSNGQGMPILHNFPDEPLLEAGPPVLPDLQSNMFSDDVPMATASVGSAEDLLDLRQSDMGWDFDFSIVDIEEFFSVYPTTGPPAF